MAVSASRRTRRPGRSIFRLLRPRGLKFSLAGSVALLFTGTAGYLTVRFPMFMGLRIMFFVMLFINALFFVRFRERGKGLFEKMMQSKFFPRKLAFTREGKFLVLISMGIGFAAVNTGSNLLYLLMSMLMSIIVASGTLSELVLRKLDWDIDLPTEAVAGAETLFAISVTNRKKRLNTFSLEGEVLLSDDRPVEQTKGRLLRLPPNHSDYLYCGVKFPARGEYEVRGIALGTRYPFSFFTKSRNYELNRNIVVVPRGEHPLEPLVFALAAGHEEHASKPGRGSEFFSVRPMQDGDEWRDVHWKQTAKTHRFAVKEHEALTSRKVYVLMTGEAVSPPQEGAEDAREEGVEIAASIIKFLVNNQFEVGLFAPGARIPPASGSSGLRKLFLTLALLDVDKEWGQGGPLTPGYRSDRDILITVNLDTGAVEKS